MKNSPADTIWPALAKRRNFLFPSGGFAAKVYANLRPQTSSVGDENGEATMSDHVLKTIEELEKSLGEQLATVANTKRFINQLCGLGHIPERYPDVEEDAKTGPRLSIRNDQFYGQPQATCVREILAMRKGLNQGPATIAEIYAALTEGGFAFETKNEDNAKRGLRISISKNTALFHKLPNGRIGLLEWYPNARTTRPKRDASAITDETHDDDDAGDDADTRALEGPK